MEIREFNIFNKLNYRYETDFYPYWNLLLCFPFSVCVYHRQSQWTKAKLFRTNPVDSTHSVRYNENNYFSLSTYRLLTSLPAHGIWISVSVGSWAEAERWKVLLSQIKFRYTPWWSFRLLKIFIIRRILWLLFAEMHQYLLEQIVFW